MTSAYKWRITGSKFAYLTTPSGGEPFIGSYTVDDEEKIATLVNTTFSGETAYATQYEKVKVAVAADPDGKNITMLSYKYYYNIDDANCGFSQEAIGPQGEQGIQGIQGIQGEKGDEGNGIKEVVVSSITDTVQRIIISFTDGRPNVYFDVQNGMNGIAAEIDYNRILSGITYLDISGQTLSGLSEYVLEQLKGLYDSKIDSINDELADAKSTLEQLTGNVGGIDNQVNTLSGITVDIYNYYDKELSAVTIIQNTVNAVSGMVSNDMEYIDVLNSAVTELGRGMLAVSGLVYDYVYRTDELENAMTGYTESFNALYGEYVRTVSQLTHSGDTEVVTLSQIRQRADTISAFTENSSGLSAGLIIAINEQENIGEVKIKADKITMDGDLIAQAITGTSLTIGSGVSHLNGDGSGSLANGNIYWSSEGDMTINGSVIANAASGVTMKFGGANGTPSAVFNADGSGYLANGHILWDNLGTTTFSGTINATKGYIGGFEIAYNHIGVDSSSSQEGGTTWANLSLYKDFLKVGGEYGYVMFGDDVIPSSAGGAFTATGRVVNGHPNSGAYWGFDQANYGIFISVSGGTKNYGIDSNAALKAPAFVNTEVGLLNFSGTTYKVDFSQHTLFLLYATNDCNVNLPGESSVASSFGKSSLPDDFGALVTFRVRPGSKSITLKGVYNWNEEQVDHTMAAGDTCQLLISKIDGFRYQVLGHDS